MHMNGIIYRDLDTGKLVTTADLRAEFTELERAGYTDNQTIDEYLFNVYNDTRRNQTNLEIISE